MAEWEVLNDVVSGRNGGKILFATDDFFAVAENLLKVEDVKWREGEYTEFGKWMDGWETRRKRKPGHDFCIIQLAAQAVIYGVDIDTSFFTGNFAPAVSLQGAAEIFAEFPRRVSEIGSEASDSDIRLIDEQTRNWMTLLPVVRLSPGYPESCHNRFSTQSKDSIRFVRFNIFPDGGVARLRMYGKVVPPEYAKPETDLVGFINGGECVAFSNAHFGHPKNLLNLSEGIGMFDGWETARRLDRPPILKELADGCLNHSGSEWCILKLGVPGAVERIVIDTSHFKGNSPDLIKIEGCTEDNAVESDANWDGLVPFYKVVPNSKDNDFKFLTEEKKIYKFIKVTIQPDGGVSRVRIFGRSA